MAFQKKPQSPHFVLIPYMAQGHLIPMVDIARLLAARGVIITIFTTPLNFKRFESVASRAVALGLQIHVIQLVFPAVEAGLPEGCECFDMIPSMASALNFFAATNMLQPSVEQWLEKLSPPPSCIIADMCHPWTNQVAEKFSIPLLIFHGYCTFSLMCIHNLSKFKELNDIASDSEYFVVPDLPHRIEMTKAQIGGRLKSNQLPILPGIQVFRNADSPWNQVLDEMREAEDKAFGVVVNSFHELEPDYVKQFKIATGKKVWCIGPVSLSNKDSQDMSERGSRSSVSPLSLKWLDSWEPNSVIYACLGSITRLSVSQLIELGLGLEESNRPFVWVIKDTPEEFKKWLLEEKFEDRIKQRGLLIYSWAPQLLILSHPSVGAFLTHCGWNSTLEGVSSGVPMITMPMFAEQFMNERLLVDVLNIAVKTGMETPVMIGYEETTGAQVTRENAKKAIEKVMDDGEEAEMRRIRAKQLGKMAREALQEGGSSCFNIAQLIHDVLMDEVRLKDKSEVIAGGDTAEIICECNV